MLRPVFRLLAVLTLLVAVSPFAHAEEEKKSRSFLEDILTVPFRTAEEVNSAVTSKIFNLGEVKVSGSRVDADKSEEYATEIPGNVTFVGQEEIALSPRSSLSEILALKEGVTYTDDTGQGINSRVDLRGFGGEAKQSLVLLDGMRAVEPFDNSMTWSLYPMEFMDQVEIRRGGGSTVYGEGALSGVISLKTKSPTEKPHASGQASWGSFGYEKYFADASATVNGIGVYAGGYYNVTDGYRQNGGHEGQAYLLKVNGGAAEFIRLENTIFFSSAETEIPGPLLPAELAQNRRQKDPEGQFGDKFDDELFQETLVASWFLEPINVELSSETGYRLRDQDSAQSFGGFFGGTSVNNIGTETFSQVLQASWLAEGQQYENRVTLGTEYSQDDIHNPFSFNSFSFGPFAADRSIDRQMMGFYGQERIKLWGHFIVEAGGRFDKIHWNIYDLLTPSLEKPKKADNFSPSIGAEWQPVEPLSIYAKYSEAFKVPDSNTLIFETPNIFSPTPGIDSQIAHHNEIGVRYAHPVFGSVRADYFYIETKKEILFNDINNINENFDTIRQGVELANEIALTEQVQLFGNYTYTQAEFDNGVFDGKDVPLVPRHHWTAGALIKPLPEWSVITSFSGVKDQFALNDFNNIFPVEDYWTADLRVAYKHKNWEVYAKGQNLFGEEYSSFMTSDGVSVVNFNPAPETTWEAGFKMEI
jgi:iron complex outermembrane receptor protein